MRYLTITLLFCVTLLAQDKGYIDMHGGKKDGLTNNKSNFSNSFSNSSSLGIQNAKEEALKHNSNKSKKMKHNNSSKYNYMIKEAK